MTETKTYDQTHWSLEDLFEGFDDPKYKAAFDEITKGVEAVSYTHLHQMMQRPAQGSRVPWAPVGAGLKKYH